MEVEKVQQARTYPFLTHKCGDVSQIEPIDDFYDAQGRRIQGYIWIPKLQQSQESESLEKATEGKEGLRGVVLFNHGYNHLMDNFYGQFGAQLNALGFAVAGIDWPGHGQSEGTRCHTTNFDEFPQLMLNFADSIVIPRLRKFLHTESSEEPLHESIPFFAYGESMGGSICLRMVSMRPDFFRGIVLSAPLCGVDPNLVPPHFVVSLGQCIAKFAPTAPVVPSEDHTDKCFKDPTKLERVKQNTARYQGRMRLGMGMEIIRTCELIQSEMSDVDVPICILHGPSDEVTQPSQSLELYHSCTSEDKTYIQYEGAYHALWWEPKDTRYQLGEDICSWLLLRSKYSKGQIRQKAFIHRREGTGDLTDPNALLE